MGENAASGASTTPDPASGIAADIKVAIVILPKGAKPEG